MHGYCVRGPSSKALCLHTVLTWGEALPVKLARAWQQVCCVVDLLIASPMATAFSLPRPAR